MSETQSQIELTTTVSSVVEFTPELGMQINAFLDSQGFYPYGHGTPVDDAETFFEEGIFITDGYMTRYHELGNIAIPIPATDPEHPDSGQQITNTDFIRNWPHKKYTDRPNVVVMAVPYGDPEKQISATRISENILDLDSDVFPPDLIAGFINAHTGMFTFNPNLNISAEIRQQLLDKVESRSSQRSALLGDMPVPSATIKLDDDSTTEENDWI